MLGNVNTTVENVNTALTRCTPRWTGSTCSWPGSTRSPSNAQHVTANVANLATVVTAAAANPLVKVAAFGYGVRRAAAKRRHAEDEAEVRDSLKQQRGPAERGNR